MFKAFNGSGNYNNKILKLLIKKIRELHNLKSKSEFQLFDLEIISYWQWWPWGFGDGQDHLQNFWESQDEVWLMRTAPGSPTIFILRTISLHSWGFTLKHVLKPWPSVKICFRSFTSFSESRARWEDLGPRYRSKPTMNISVPVILSLVSWIPSTQPEVMTGGYFRE